ncbi:MAG: cytochrome c5 family protein [Betaproteobacteria bacterium]|nr:cytochrome c5 family protein [Betaproteobacteria bacterium]
MSHHPDPVEENIETHPVKLAIAVTVGAIGLVVGIVLLAYFAVGTHRVGQTADNANTPEAIKARIAPLVDVQVDESKGPVGGIPGDAKVMPVSAKASAPAAAIVPAVIPPAGAASATQGGGEGTYKAACGACHAAGIAGAPKTGDKAGWASRIAKGKPMLYDHALKGFNGMPAKGGQTALADADVKAAVDYMIAQSK